MSPCGLDDSRWEDCTWCAFIEFWRAAGHPEIPATHAEAEALRCAAGMAPSGGSNLGNIRDGVKARYGQTTPTPLHGPTAIWNAMTPGTVATVGGSMSAFESTSRWRRWDRHFAGTHSICAFRPDATDRVWWCDPLAPTQFSSGTSTSTYVGESMPKADFLRFIAAASTAGALVLPIMSGEEMDRHIIPEGRAMLAAGPAWSDPDLTRVLTSFSADVPVVQVYGRSATVAALRVDLKSGPEEDIHVAYVPLSRITMAGGDP